MSTEIIAPPTFLLQAYFKDNVLNFFEQLKKKINDGNVVKSSAANPHRRECFVGNIHNLTFSVLACKCRPSEKVERNAKVVKFNLYSLSRMEQLFQAVDLIRFHKTGDITLCAPWGILKEDIDVFEKSSFVVILEYKQDYVKIFMPCGGPDPDTDVLPDWVSSIKLDKLCKVDIEKIKPIKSNGISSKITKGENWFLALRDQVEEEDYVKFHGET